MAMVASDQEKQQLLLRRLTLALLVTGILWRALRYLLCFPIWGDEAMLCLNFQELDYAGLTHQLRYCQVAPLLFLWGELTLFRLFGGSELAMHLLPFLAGLGALLLFWRLARLTLSPLAATLAVGFLAVAIWPVSMSTLVKPYAFDLFMALLILLPAAHFLRQPQQVRWLALLLLAIPVAVFGSFPVVFVGGAISLALLPAVWRQQGRSAHFLYVAYNITLVACFLGNYWIVGQGQLQTSTGGETTEVGMQTYWAEGFPPAAPFAFIKWLLLTHTGQMSAYPIGASDGGSTLTFLLCLLGAWRLWASRQRALLVLCTAPFALWFLAAVLHRYPYGASCRLSQHVAPLICLMAGLGAAGLIERLRSVSLRQRWIVVVCAFFVLVGVGGMIRDAIKPYRDLQTLWMCQVMREFTSEAQSDAPIIVLNDPRKVDPVIRWHLGLCGDRVSWNSEIDWDRAAASGEILCVRYWIDEQSASEERDPYTATAQPPTEFAERLRDCKERWVLKKAVTHRDVPVDGNDPFKHLDQFRWVLETNDQLATAEP